MNTHQIKKSAAALLLLSGTSIAGAHELPKPQGMTAEELEAAKPAAMERAMNALIDSIVTDAHAAANVKITVRNGTRYIRANGLPNHGVGKFPNRGNPNRIRAQSYNFKMPARPRKGGAKASRHMIFGVALNGVVLDPGTAEFWNGNRNFNYEAIGGSVSLGLDSNNAHVQPTGAYHYHGIPKGLMRKYSYRSKPTLLGYAADGFPIYAPYGYRVSTKVRSGMKLLTSSWRLKKGKRSGGPGGRNDGTFTTDYAYVSGAGDLDRCNGRTGVTPEFPNGTYHYVLTSTFPYIPRCFMGSADSSFRHRGGPPGRGLAGAGPRRQGQGQFGNAPRRQRNNQAGNDNRRQPQGGQQFARNNRGGPPQEALDACANSTEGRRCSFNGRGRKVSGTCRRIPEGVTACVPRR